jgi:hypothetical protein
MCKSRGTGSGPHLSTTQAKFRDAWFDEDDEHPLNRDGYIYAHIRIMMGYAAKHNIPWNGTLPDEALPHDWVSAI